MRRNLKSAKVKVPLSAFDSRAKGKGAVMQVTLRWNKNTGNIAVMCGAAELDNVFATIKGIDIAHSQLLDGNVTMSEPTEFPEWQVKMMTILVQEFGLGNHDGSEHFDIDVECEEEWQEEVGPIQRGQSQWEAVPKVKPKAEAGQRMSGR